MNKEQTKRDLRAMLKRLDGLRDKVEEQRAAIRGALEVYEHGLDDVMADFKDMYEELPKPESWTGAVGDGIQSILLLDRPLHRKDILSRLLEQGYHIGGKNPVDSVSAHLSTAPRFKSLGNGEWTLTTEPVEEAKQARLGQADSPERQDVKKVAPERTS